MLPSSYRTPLLIFSYYWASSSPLCITICQLKFCGYEGDAHSHQHGLLYCQTLSLRWFLVKISKTGINSTLIYFIISFSINKSQFLILSLWISRRYFSDKWTTLDDAEEAMLEMYCEGSQLKRRSRCSWSWMRLLGRSVYTLLTKAEKAYINEQIRHVCLLIRYILTYLHKSHMHPNLLLTIYFLMAL